VSQQPHPVFRLEGQKTVSRIQFSARYKTELEKFSLLSIWSSGKWLDNCQFESLLVVFDFSFDVLAHDCMSNLWTPCDVHFEKQTRVSFGVGLGFVLVFKVRVCG